MRRVYILPNLFTAGNLYCGLMAIFVSIHGGDPAKAIGFIFLAGILDVFDGLIARLTNAQSAFGLNFDSICDVVSFGVAPAFIIYMHVYPLYPEPAQATCGLYVICGAIRLARYNVQAGNEEKRSFTGIPIPGAAAGVLSIFWILYENPKLADFMPINVVMPPIMIIVAYLMISKYPYLGLKSFPIRRKQTLENFVVIFIVAMILWLLKSNLPLLCFVVGVPYLFLGPIIFYYRKARDGRRTIFDELEEEAANEDGRKRRRKRRRRRKKKGTSTGPDSESGAPATPSAEPESE